MSIRSADILSAVKLHMDEGSSHSAFIQEWEVFGSQQYAAIMADLQAAALAEILPNLEDGFSLPVFVAELKDLRGMVGGVCKLIASLPKAVTSLFNAPLRELSQAQLSASFGWIPFVSDTRKLISRLYNLQQDVAKFVKEADKRRTYHYTIRLSPSDILGQGYFDTTDLDDIVISTESLPQPEMALSTLVDSITFGHRFTRSCQYVYYNVSVDYSYSLNDMSGWGPILAGLDRLGINFSLSDFWEVVPFSFVVDWFYRVQDVAERFDMTNVPPQIHIYDFCESIKFDYAEMHSLYVKEVTPCLAWQPELDDAIWGSPVNADNDYRESAYYRRVSTPLISHTDFPNLTCPKGMQIALGGALLGART
jgi:hypothetical protein